MVHRVSDRKIFRVWEATNVVHVMCTEQHIIRQDSHQRQRERVYVQPSDNSIATIPLATVEPELKLLFHILYASLTDTLTV